MRILYVTERLPFGRGEAFIIDEIQELRRLGHDVRIVPAFPGGRIEHDDARALAGLVSGAESRWLSRRGIAAFAFGVKASLASRLPRIALRNVQMALRAWAVASEVRRWGPEHIHAHWANYTSTLAMCLAHVLRCPWSFTAHRYDIAYDNLISLKLSSATFARAIDERGAARLSALRDEGGCPVTVIHMGVDTRHIAPARRPPDATKLVIAGNLVEIKGHVDLFAALREVRASRPGVSLDVVGAGPLRDRLESRVATMDLGAAVRFRGHLPHAAFISRLSAGEWDILVHPSIVTADGETEGIPVVLMEALAAGVPVVSTTTGGIPELLRDGAGYLVPPRDPAALARGITALVSSAELRAQQSGIGRARVEAEFSVYRTAAALARRITDSCTT